MDPQLSAEIVTNGTRNVTFPVEGHQEGTGYLSDLSKDSKIGIVLVQEWWGLNQSLCITADKFAQQGFRVLVPDVYRGETAKNREEAGHYYKDLNWEGAVADMKGAALHLKNSLGCSKVGIVGFCLGGALAYAALSATNVFEAGAPFYGICDLTKFPLKNITAPIQAHFAEFDKSHIANPELSKQVEKEALDLKLDYQNIIWPNAMHAFMNQNSTNYNPEVASKALEEVSTFFKAKLA